MHSAGLTWRSRLTLILQVTVRFDLGGDPGVALVLERILHPGPAGQLPWRLWLALRCASLTLDRRLQDAWTTVLRPSHPARLAVG